MSNYDYYFAALAGKNPPVHDGDPQPGFYYMKSKKHGRVLIAIFESESEIVAVAGVSFDPANAKDIWTWVAGNPIPETLYRQVVADKGKWPDDPGIGHNQPSSEFETLQDQIDSADVLAGNITLPITKQLDADKASNIRDRLNELSKAADLARLDARRPLQVELKAIQDKWVPLVDGAKDGADRLRKAIGDYLRALEEQQRKAAEEARKAQEKAAREAEAQNKPAPEPVEAPKPKAQVGGLRGKKASLVTTYRANIVDWEKCLAAFADNPEVKALIQKLANKVARAKGKTPGVEIIEEKEAR